MNTQPTSRTKKKKGAATARTRSRAWTVLDLRPTHLHGRHIGWNSIRLRRKRPRAARGVTRVRNTSKSAPTSKTMPSGSAIHRIAFRRPYAGPSTLNTGSPDPERTTTILASRIALSMDGAGGDVKEIPGAGV